MDSPQKVVLSLSGGMDSSTLLAYLLDLGYDVECLNFTYGSKHNQYEIESAEKIAEFYNVSYKLINLTEAFSIFSSNLLKTGGDIPEGHYEEENMSKTVVPGRNSIFACILMGYAESINFGKIALGVHQGDHCIYPDTRQEYIKALDTMVYLASDKNVEVITPFIDINKTEICKIGLNLKVPFEITRTCYKDQKNSCGKCGACIERLESFELNESEDPITYEENKQQFETLEGITMGIELVKEQLTNVTNPDKVIEFSNKLKDLLENKKNLEDDFKKESFIKSEEKTPTYSPINVNLIHNEINKRKIILQNELVKKTNQLQVCKKEKNKQTLKDEIDVLKHQLTELEEDLNLCLE